MEKKKNHKEIGKWFQVFNPPTWPPDKGSNTLG